MKLRMTTAAEAYLVDTDRLWEAAYAAAFVACFVEKRSVIDSLGRGSYSFDQALENNAEEAITVAYEAVKQLREWEKENG